MAADYEEAVMDEFRTRCITYILNQVRAGEVQLEDVVELARKEEDERELVPEVVRTERFLENAKKWNEDRLVNVLEKRVARMHIEASTSDTSTDQYAMYSDDSDTEDGPMTLAGEVEYVDSSPRVVNLNPLLRITEEEHRTWLWLIKSLTKSRNLTQSDAPRKLLMLMSKQFTAAVAVEAADALFRLNAMFQDSWFGKEEYKVLKRVCKRGLLVMGVKDYGGASGRRARLKQRRKVFRARKRLWDDEYRNRKELESDFDLSMKGFLEEWCACPRPVDPADPPAWFAGLLQEHLASLEEQFARTSLEHEYTTLTSSLFGAFS